MEKSLDIAVAGGGTQQLKLSSAGTGANAVHINASAGGIDIDSSGTPDIDSNAVEIDTVAGVSIDAAADSNITVTGETKDLDIAVLGGGTQELRIASAGTGSSAVHINASAGGINIDSSSTLDIDSNTVEIDTVAGVSIDAAADSNLTVTAEGKDLDIAVVGGGTQELRLASAGTGLNAIHLNASAGGINVDSSSTLDIDSNTVQINAVNNSNLTVTGNGKSLDIAGSRRRYTAIKIIICWNWS